MLAGTFVLLDAAPTLVLDNVVVPWTVSGCAAARALPGGGAVEVIAPPSSVAGLRAGYAPQIDPAALSAIRGRS